MGIHLWRYVVGASLLLVCVTDASRVRRQDGYGSYSAPPVQSPQPSYGPPPPAQSPQPNYVAPAPAPAPQRQQPNYGGGGNFAQPQQQQQQQQYDDGSTNDPAKALMMLMMAVPGNPGTDYPIFSAIPQTSFQCSQQQLPGYYADVEAQCQVFWVCSPGGKQDGFLCPNGTIFHQQYFTCDWWYNVKCQDSASFYGLNSQLYQDPGPSSYQQQQQNQGGFQQQQQSYRPPPPPPPPAQQGYQQQGGFQQQQQPRPSPQPSYNPAPQQQQTYNPAPQQSYSPPQQSYSPPQQSYSPPQQSFSAPPPPAPVPSSGYAY